MGRAALLRLPWRTATYGPAINTSLTANEAQELERLAAGKRVLEVGAAFGYSAILMALAGAEVISVDPHDAHQSADAMRLNTKQHGVWCRIVQRLGTSADILPNLPDATFDLVFVDGDHTAAGVAFDLNEAQRLAAPHGILAFHDWDEESCPDVRTVLQAWRQPDRVVDTLAVYHLA